MPQNIYGLGDFSTNQIRDLAKASEESGIKNPLIFQRRPDAAPDSANFISQIPPDLTAHIIPDAFGGSLGMQIAVRLTVQQLEKIGSEADPYLRAAIKIALRGAAHQSPDDPKIKKMADYVNQSPAWQ